MVYSVVALIASLFIFSFLLLFLTINKKFDIEKYFWVIISVSSIFFVSLILLNSITLFLNEEFVFKTKFAIFSAYIFIILFYVLECLLCIFKLLKKRISEIELENK